MKEKFMNEALKQAKIAFEKDEVPIGCVIVLNDKIIARAHNLRESKQQSIAHAEILAIQKACRKINSWRLENCEIYVTVEPCSMCAGAIMQSRIKKVYYGTQDYKGGAIESNYEMYKIKGFNHYPDYEGNILKEECSKIIKDFFAMKRKNK